MERSKVYILFISIVFSLFCFSVIARVTLNRSSLLSSKVLKIIKEDHDSKKLEAFFASLPTDDQKKASSNFVIKTILLNWAKIKNRIPLMKVAFNYGADPNLFVNELSTFSDLALSVIVRLFLQEGLDGSKIIKSVILNKKPMTLKLLENQKISIPEDLKDKADELLASAPSTLFNQLKVLRELKDIFRQKERVLHARPNKYTSITAFLSTYPIGGAFFSTWTTFLEDYKLNDKKIMQEQKKQEMFARPFKDGNIDDKALGLFLDKVFFNEKYLQKLVKKNNPEFKGFSRKDKKDYLELIKKMHYKEQKMPAYNVFYHGHTNDIGVLIDMVSEFRNWVELKGGQAMHLRLTKLVNSNKVKLKSIKEYINYWTNIFKIRDWDKALAKVYGDWSDVLKSVCPGKFETKADYAKNNWKVRGGGKTMLFPYFSNWSDNVEPHKSQVLCVNFSPFAFIYNMGENSLAYFMADRSIKAPDWIDGIFEGLGFEKDDIQSIKDLHDKYIKPEKGGQMLQIFIPVDKVDQFAYISTPLGKPLIEQIAGVGYDDKMGYHTKTSEFLNKYMNDPSSLILKSRAPYENMVVLSKDKKLTKDIYAFKIMNEHQGRIVLFPEFFDPDSGVKIVRYNFVSEANKKKYKEEFKKAFDKMMLKWVNSGAYKKLGDDIANKRLVKLLDLMKRGKIEEEMYIEHVPEEMQDKEAEKPDVGP